MQTPTILRTTTELDAWLSADRARPVLLFKHSLICPVSHAAHAEYLDFVASSPSVDTALIEIQNQRELSTAVAERSGVRHESPQALLLVGGKVVWHASHGGIRESTLRSAVEEHSN
jgi:bacillithiol system protein YtxJ